MKLATDEQIIAEVAGAIRPKRKRTRAKPSRCVDCGKVSARVRCNECWTRRLEV